MDEGNFIACFLSRDSTKGMEFMANNMEWIEEFLVKSQISPKCGSTTEKKKKKTNSLLPLIGLVKRVALGYE